MPMRPGRMRAWAPVMVGALSIACATDRTSAVRRRESATRGGRARPATAGASAAIGPTIVVIAEVALTPQEEAAMAARVRAAFAFALWSAPRSMECSRTS